MGQNQATTLQATQVETIAEEKGKDETPTFAKSVGERLLNLRQELEEKEDKKISRATLAEDIGCSAASIRQWEEGEAAPGASYLCKLSERFDVSTDYILGLTQHRNRINFANSSKPETPIIPWGVGAAPLIPGIGEGIGLFTELASGNHSSWDFLLKGQKPKRADTALRIIEEDVARRIIDIGDLKRDRETEAQMKEKFPFLKDNALVVADFPIELDNFKKIQQLLVAHMAAQCFHRIVEPGDNVAISGGSTLLKFVRCLRYDPSLKGLTFYPLDINPLAVQVELDASSIVALIKVILSCKGFALHHEAMAEEKFDPTALSTEAFNVYQGARASQLAFVGVGNPLTREIFRVAADEFISNDDFEEHGVVADLLFHLLNKSGQEVVLDNHFNARVASLPLGDLKTIAKRGCVVGVVHGIEKAAAVKAVLAGEYISGLVTHKTLAREILTIE